MQPWHQELPTVSIMNTAWSSIVSFLPLLFGTFRKLNGNARSRVTHSPMIISVVMCNMVLLSSMTISRNGFISCRNCFISLWRFVSFDCLFDHTREGCNTIPSSSMSLWSADMHINYIEVLTALNSGAIQRNDMYFYGTIYRIYSCVTRPV